MSEQRPGGPPMPPDDADGVEGERDAAPGSSAPPPMPPAERAVGGAEDRPRVPLADRGRTAPDDPSPDPRRAVDSGRFAGADDDRSADPGWVTDPSAGPAELWETTELEIEPLPDGRATSIGDGPPPVPPDGRRTVPGGAAAPSPPMPTGEHRLPMDRGLDPALDPTGEIGVPSSPVIGGPPPRPGDGYARPSAAGPMPTGEIGDLAGDPSPAGLAPAPTGEIQLPLEPAADPGPGPSGPRPGDSGVRGEWSPPAKSDPPSSAPRPGDSGLAPPRGEPKADPLSPVSDLPAPIPPPPGDTGLGIDPPPPLGVPDTGSPTPAAMDLPPPLGAPDPIPPPPAADLPAPVTPSVPPAGPGTPIPPPPAADLSAPVTPGAPPAGPGTPIPAAPPMPSADFARPAKTPPPMPSADHALGAPPPPSAESEAPPPPGAPPPSPGGERAAPFVVEAADTDRSTGSLMLPLAGLAAGTFVTVVVGFLVARGREIDLDNLRGLSVHLGGFGPWSGLLVALAAGLVTIHRPASKRASSGAAVLGGLVAFGGLVALLTSLSFGGGLGGFVRVLLNGVTSGPGAAIVLGAVSAFAAWQASQDGSEAPTLPVIGLLAAAGLQALNGLTSAVYGFFDFFGLLEKVWITFAAFDQRVAALLVAAAVLLTLYRGRSDLNRIVVLAAVVVIGMTLLSSVLFLVVEREATFAFNNFVTAPAGVALAATAGVLGVVADRTR